MKLKNCFLTHGFHFYARYIYSKNLHRIKLIPNLDFRLSMPHDDDVKCTSFRNRSGAHNIMSRMLDGNTRPWEWSKCSRHYVTEFLEWVSHYLDEPLNRLHFEKCDTDRLTLEYNCDFVSLVRISFSFIRPPMIALKKHVVLKNNTRFPAKADPAQKCHVNLRWSLCKNTWQGRVKSRKIQREREKLHNTVQYLAKCR